MMYDRGKSDSSVVPRKLPNNAGRPAAEVVEGSGLAKGNSPEGRDGRTQRRIHPSDGIERVRQAARRDKNQRFTALMHHVYAVDRLRAAYFALKRDAAAGIDGETWKHYGDTLEDNLRDLAARLTRGAFRASPVRRAYIPKADGRQRPLGVPTLEDTLVQRAVVDVLNAIYEADFLGFSYGFRPTRSVPLGVPSPPMARLQNGDYTTYATRLGRAVVGGEMRLDSMPSRAASRNMLLLCAAAAVVLIVSTIASPPDRVLLVPLIIGLCLAGVRRHLLNWRRPRLAAHEAGED